MRRLAHARVLPSPLVSPHYYIHDPITSYHPAPRNLERRPQISRAATIFDIIPQHLATHCKHPTDMRTDQRDHFCTRQCGRVTVPCGNASTGPSIPRPVEIASSLPPPHLPGQIQGVNREYPPRPALHVASHSGVLVLGNSRLLYTATKATTSPTDSAPD